MHDRQLIDETQRVWSEWSGAEITSNDAREIIRNIRGFFGVLAKWNRRDKQQGNTNAR